MGDDLGAEIVSGAGAANWLIEWDYGAKQT